MVNERTENFVVNLSAPTIEINKTTSTVTALTRQAVRIQASRWIS